MSRTIEIRCQNCGKLNKISESDLVSGVPTKDLNGNIIEEHPPVTIDDNTVVQCEHCRYPMSCANAKILS